MSRFCIVTSEFPPVTAYHGGIGTQYGRLAPELVRLGHEVHVVTLAPDAANAESIVHGVHVRALHRGRLWPWYPLAWSTLVQRALRELGSFDAVLAPEFRGEAYLYSLQQSQGTLVTHLTTSLRQLLAVRPGLPLREHIGPRARLTDFMERQQTQHSRALIATGGAVLEWAQKLWSLDSLTAVVVPCSIDVTAVRRHGQGSLPEGFPNHGPVVTLASRLDGHKGAQHLLAAMKRVWQVHPNAQLVYVGRDARWKRGWMSDHLRELAGEDAHRVHLLGGQPSAQYFSAVVASDVIAIPSLWESFCIAALEAMALGRPVIGTRDNGFSEFIVDGENGLLVDRGDVDELGEALLRLLDEPGTRDTLGAAAAQTAQNYDVEHVAPRYVEALERLI